MSSKATVHLTLTAHLYQDRTAQVYHLRLVSVENIGNNDLGK